MILTDDVSGVLLDIEGTTTPIAFVHDVLFNYAREHLKEFLRTNSAPDDLALLRDEHAVDVKEGRNPPPLTNDSVAEYIEWLISRDRKSTGLKSLQGKIWRQGYEKGLLKSQVFADVPPALARWRARELKIIIFSSGSVLAQKLLFAHTDAGNLTPFIDGYFDTTVGKKGEAESYLRIAEAIGFRTEQILFISDVVSELDAANEAGMKTILSIRPGNSPQPQRYTSITTFESI